MNVVKTALQNVFKKRVNFILLVLLTTFFLLIYYQIIERTVTLGIFLKMNTAFYVFSQLFLTIVNSFLGAVSIIFLIEALKLKRKSGRDLLQAGGSLSLSILSTGCYICGTLIIPIVGLTGFFSSLPFAGLEIKVFTLLILVLTVINLSEKILGICAIERKKYLSLKFDNKNIIFDMKLFWRYKLPILVSIFVVGIIFFSMIIPRGLVNSSNGYSCPTTLKNN